MNIFNGIFSPRTVVGLQVDGRVIRAVQVSNPSGSPSLDHMAQQEIGEGDVFTEVLREFWQREKFKAEVVFTSIPASLAYIREMDLPVNSLKKLDKIVKYQMEPYVPHPIDEMVVDFFPPLPGRPMVMAGVRKTSLSKHLEQFASAGLTPAQVTLEDAALFSLYVRTHPVAADLPTALVHLKSEETVVMVIEQGQLLFLRSLQGGSGALDQLKQTLALYQLKNTGKPHGSIRVTGSAAADASLVERIQTMTETETSLWLPFDHLKNGRTGIAPEQQAEMSVPFGLALGSTVSAPRMLDFRKEEFRLETALDLKKMAVYGLTVTLILLAVFTFSTYRRLTVTEAAYKSLNLKMARTLSDTFPQNRTVIKGRELAQMKQLIAAEKDRYRWLEEITASGKILETLLVLNNILAGYRDVKIDNISIEGARILLDGQASSFKIVDSLKSKLEQANFFHAARLISAKMDSQDDMIRFSFRMEKKNESEKI